MTSVERVGPTRAHECPSSEDRFRRAAKAAAQAAAIGLTPEDGSFTTKPHSSKPIWTAGTTTSPSRGTEEKLVAA